MFLIVGTIRKNAGFSSEVAVFRSSDDNDDDDDETVPGVITVFDLYNNDNVKNRFLLSLGKKNFQSSYCMPQEPRSFES